MKPGKAVIEATNRGSHRPQSTHTKVQPFGLFHALRPCMRNSRDRVVLLFRKSRVRAKQ